MRRRPQEGTVHSTTGRQQKPRNGKRKQRNGRKPRVCVWVWNQWLPEQVGWEPLRRCFTGDCLADVWPLRVFGGFGVRRIGAAHCVPRTYAIGSGVGFDRISSFLSCVFVFAFVSIDHKNNTESLPHTHSTRSTSSNIPFVRRTAGCYDCFLGAILNTLTPRASASSLTA